MVRVALTTIASFILVGVLALLIMESRTVDENYYAAHTARVRAIEATRDDLSAITLGTQSAHKEGRSVPATLSAALARLPQHSALLQGAAATTENMTDLQMQLVLYDAALGQFVSDTTAFVARQDGLAEALRLVQEESPAVVKDLRRFNLRIQSQNAFSLAIEVIEFATGQNQADPEQLKIRLTELGDDPAVDSRAPGRIDDFVAAAMAVIAEHDAAATALERVTGSRVTDALWALSDAIQSENRLTVSRAERARLLLSVCTIALLAGIGYVVYRLQSSYRALNRSNSELEAMNNSLEERVSSRTEQLSSAYDELQESQVQLVQAEKMSSLGELVAGISHEINTPLWYLINNATIIQERLESVSELATIADSMITAIRSGTDVKTTLQRGLKNMQTMLSEGMTDDLEEANDLIRDSIEGLEDLTELAQSLKDFSRLDRAQQGQFDVNEGLDKTLLITKNKLKNKVTVHKHFGEVPAIHCSPSQINQVFLNLITNAADAIEESGEIVVRSWEEDGNVKVSVADSGCGIPDDVMEKIRDPFFTTKEVGKGTGLGLSIVDRIISAHHGNLEIESVVGKGTVMTITLPQEVGLDPNETADEATEAGLVAAADATMETEIVPEGVAANETAEATAPSPSPENKGDRDGPVPDVVTA